VTSSDGGAATRDDDGGDGDDGDDEGSRERERAGRGSAARGKPGLAGSEPDATRCPSRSAAGKARRHPACRTGRPSSRAPRTPHTRSSARGKQARARASLARTRGLPLGSARIASCCRTFCKQSREEINIMLPVHIVLEYVD